MSHDEAQRLAAIARRSTYAAGLNGESIRYCFRVFERHLRGASILELGPAEGVMTELLAGTGMPLTVVEGSAAFCADLARRFPHVHVVHALFEDYVPARTFDNVVLGHVLEHVADPVAVLARARHWIAPGGRLLAAVPNSASLHRQAAVLMGLLPRTDALNEADLGHGHRRVFDLPGLRRAIDAAGLHVAIAGGYWLKPLANHQIEATWTPAMLDAFMALGERYPDIAGEIYVVATLP